MGRTPSAAVTPSREAVGVAAEVRAVVGVVRAGDLPRGLVEPVGRGDRHVGGGPEGWIPERTAGDEPLPGRAVDGLLHEGVRGHLAGHDDVLVDRPELVRGHLAVGDLPTADRAGTDLSLYLPRRGTASRAERLLITE